MCTYTSASNVEMRIKTFSLPYWKKAKNGQVPATVYLFFFSGAADRSERGSGLGSFLLPPPPTPLPPTPCCKDLLRRAKETLTEGPSIIVRSNIANKGKDWGKYPFFFVVLSLGLSLCLGIPLTCGGTFGTGIVASIRRTKHSTKEGAGGEQPWAAALPRRHFPTVAGRENLCSINYGPI